VGIEVSEATNKRREGFFRLLFGDSRGYICVAYLQQDIVSGRGVKKKTLTEEYFMYPDEMPQMLEYINKHYVGHNMYYCAQLLTIKSRTKDDVAPVSQVWADLDSCPPERMLVEPSITIESSPGRYQALWRLEKAIDPFSAEDISRRIAYYHAADGADKSGWDLTQLLRIPFTYNYKYGDSAATEVPIVKIIAANRNEYKPDNFKDYPVAVGFEHYDIPFPEVFPEGTGTDILHKYRFKVSPLTFNLYEVAPEHDWSGKLWQLLMLCFESDMTREEAYIVGKTAACNKWLRDGRQDADKMLWREICKAWNKSQEHLQVLSPMGKPEEPLVSDEERAFIEANPSFVERYIEWASNLGDAASQYHQAGAFMALSSLLAGTVNLPTSFGTIVPNLWFMILADTTLTRKTTAMDIAMDLVMEVDSDIVLATDGSIEGLLTSLGTRPGRPSVFLRDEFSGLLEMITKKDYYAGMPELLTKLYDGKMQKRVLRKETIEVRDPVLILFTGGILNKITGLLTFEQVSSGFMPRFIFITAESDVTKLQPLGPPTEIDLGNRQAILNELSDLKAHYSGDTVMEIQGVTGTKPTLLTVPKKWKAALTPEAWMRYNEIESGMLEQGLQSERPEIMTPVNDRLSKSILKAAVLIAAERQRELDHVTVEPQDVARAAYYGEQWRGHVKVIMSSVGKGFNERQLDTMLATITNRPGVSRSQIMQQFHLNARQTDEAFTTLEQRGLIKRERAGKSGAEKLFPLSQNKKGVAL